MLYLMLLSLVKTTCHLRNVLAFFILKFSMSIRLKYPQSDRSFVSAQNTFFFDNINVVVSRVLCASKKQLIKALKIILDEGGEGVILRRPGSKYEHGRSNHLFKLKVKLHLSSPFMPFVILYYLSLFKTSNTIELGLTWRPRSTDSRS